MNAQDIIDHLHLQEHQEGGFFRRTFQADERAQIDTEGGKRYLMTSIYYLLTSSSSIGHWHINRSDIIHYFHAGNPIEYSMLYPSGELKTVTLGNDITQGQHLQLHVEGNVWKSSRLLNGPYDFGLISEAVSPGFDVQDMRMADADELIVQYPQHAQLIRSQAKKLKVKHN